MSVDESEEYLIYEPVSFLRPSCSSPSSPKNSRSTPSSPADSRHFKYPVAKSEDRSYYEGRKKGDEDVENLRRFTSLRSAISAARSSTVIDDDSNRNNSDNSDSVGNESPMEDDNHFLWPYAFNTQRSSDESHNNGSVFLGGDIKVDQHGKQIEQEDGEGINAATLPRRGFKLTKGDLSPMILARKQRLVSLPAVTNNEIAASMRPKLRREASLDKSIERIKKEGRKTSVIRIESVL